MAAPRARRLGPEIDVGRAAMMLARWSDADAEAERETADL